jgi:hypothetical protein
MHFSRRTGAFTGTPKRSGKATLVVQVSDRLGGMARVTFRLTVKP